MADIPRWEGAGAPVPGAVSLGAVAVTVSAEGVVVSEPGPGSDCGGMSRPVGEYTDCT